MYFSFFVSAKIQFFETNKILYTLLSVVYS